MTVPTQIVGGGGAVSKVTRFGQLVTAPLDYSTPSFFELDEEDLAYNFIAPTTGSAIVITDITLSTDRSAPNAGTRVAVYEADSADTLDVLANIAVYDLGKQRDIVLTGLNMIVGSGRYVNVKTEDTNVLATIMFYRVKVPANG